jgi:hypothetical protein
VRIATMILGLILMVIVGLQSCAVSFGGSLANRQEVEEGGAVGYSERSSGGPSS